AHLGARQVDEDAEVLALFVRDLADAVVAGARLVDGAVGEPEPGNVHPGGDHRPERGLVVGGGSDGGDDLRASLHDVNATGPLPACRGAGAVLAPGGGVAPGSVALGAQAGGALEGTAGVDALLVEQLGGAIERVRRAEPVAGRR